jgi:hypothetical protein
VQRGDSKLMEQTNTIIDGLGHISGQITNIGMEMVRLGKEGSTDLTFSDSTPSLVMQANGGFIPKGTDRIATMLPTGSYVMNSTASKHLTQYLASGGFAGSKSTSTAITNTKKFTSIQNLASGGFVDNSKKSEQYFTTTDKSNQMLFASTNSNQYLTSGGYAATAIPSSSKQLVQYLAEGGFTSGGFSPTLSTHNRQINPNYSSTQLNNNSISMGDLNITLQGSGLSTEQQALQLGKAFQRQIRLGRLRG